MSLTIFLDNSANSADSNPPGYSIWVGGHEHGDPAGIKVDKTDTKLAYKLTQTAHANKYTNLPLQTWYYNYGWYSSYNIEGPFVDNQTIQLKKITA